MFIPPEVVIVPMVFGIPASVVGLRMWLRHKEKMAELGSGPRGTQGALLEERITRIEQAVDAIAVEVERVGEGQRFVTKLLSEGAHRER